MLYIITSEICTRLLQCWSLFAHMTQKEGNHFLIIDFIKLSWIFNMTLKAGFMAFNKASFIESNNIFQKIPISKKWAVSVVASDSLLIWIYALASNSCIFHMLDSQLTNYNCHFLLDSAADTQWQHFLLDA